MINYWTKIGGRKVFVTSDSVSDINPSCIGCAFIEKDCPKVSGKYLCKNEEHGDLRFLSVETAKAYGWKEYPEVGDTVWTEDGKTEIKSVRSAICFSGLKLSRKMFAEIFVQEGNSWKYRDTSLYTS